MGQPGGSKIGYMMLYVCLTTAGDSMIPLTLGLTVGMWASEFQKDTE